MASQSFIYLVTLTFTEIWRNFPQKMIFTCFLFQTLHKTVIRKVYHWRKLGNTQKFSKNAKISKAKWISALELAKNSWKKLLTTISWKSISCVLVIDKTLYLIWGKKEGIEWFHRFLNKFFFAYYSICRHVLFYHIYFHSSLLTPKYNFK